MYYTNDCIPSRHRNTGLVSGGVHLSSWGEGASLALVGHASSDSIMIKIPFYYVDQLCSPSCPIGIVQTKSDFIVRPVETGVGR